MSGQLAIGLGVFIVAYASISVLLAKGFDNAIMMVFLSVLVATVALVAIRIRTNLKR